MSTEREKDREIKAERGRRIERETDREKGREIKTEFFLALASSV